MHFIRVAFQKKKFDGNTHLHSLQATKGEWGFFFNIGSWSRGGLAGSISEFEVRQKYHTSVALDLEGLSSHFWSVGGCTVMVGS